MNMDSVTTASGADTITFYSDKTNRPQGTVLGTYYTFTRSGNEIDLTVNGGTPVPLITGLGTYGPGKRIIYLSYNAGVAWVPN